MASPKGYRVLTRVEAEKLQFHNLKRLMNKVRAHIGFWENTGNPCDENALVYPASAARNLAGHKEFFEMLRDVSRNHPHKDSPKLRKRHGLS
jgi:hypothetical protein